MKVAIKLQQKLFRKEANMEKKIACKKQYQATVKPLKEGKNFIYMFQKNDEGRFYYLYSASFF